MELFHAHLSRKMVVVLQIVVNAQSGSTMQSLGVQNRKRSRARAKASLSVLLRFASRSFLFAFSDSETCEKWLLHGSLRFSAWCLQGFVIDSKCKALYAGLHSALFRGFVKSSMRRIVTDEDGVYNKLRQLELAEACSSFLLLLVWF
jgi:hypothetical protein